ncbi:MAG TPA: beta-eliminating lyase-related protein [Actinocrinis sp.]|nr:beta-eliminating lyase-related protein [Actinocrinis sp.]
MDAPTEDQEDLRERMRAAMRGDIRKLSGTSQPSMHETLAALAADPDAERYLSEPPDYYGGGLVRTLERRVAELLDKPDAAFFPTGTMAQQVALRCWAQVTGSEVVATHPLAHIEVHERHAYRDLTGLRGVWPTVEPRLPAAAEVLAAERFGTLALELPLRDAGFHLPTWDELAATVAAARERDARVHVDGARLWECEPHFGRPLAQIAALADSVYVSFYKSLGGLSGAIVAGPAEFTASAKAWRHRYGGMVFQQWPTVLTALLGLDRELPRLPGYVEHARTVAKALAETAADLPGAGVFPDPPHTHQFRLWAPYRADTLNEAALGQAEQTDIALADWWVPGPQPGISYTEITVASNALDWTAQEVAAAFAALLERADRISRTARG